MEIVLPNWQPSSWQRLPALQQPKYDDAALVAQVLNQLKTFPALVQAESIRTLKKQLALAANGKAFVLQGGDCAEPFAHCNPGHIGAQLRLFAKMTAVLSSIAALPIISIGRIAGQFAKPRSEDFEYVAGQRLPVFRGECINGPQATQSARRPDPLRLIAAYEHARAAIQSLQEVQMAYFASPFYTSHEGLHLGFEESMTRFERGEYFNLGAHFLWIGDRTRQFEGAHVEYFRGIENPVGIKLGSSAEVDEVVDVCRVLNPLNEDGKIVLISRFGKEQVQDLLPPLIKGLQKARVQAAFFCDPMHGNTQKVESGKTRYFDDIVGELELSFEIHRKLRCPLAGVHLEMTAAAVDEVRNIGSGAGSYESLCDPRLNAEQSLQLARGCGLLLHTTQGVRVAAH